VKADGLARYGHLLASADSYAWSSGARKRNVLLPGCDHPGGDCRNCPKYAHQWRGRVADALDAAAPAVQQLALAL
jgi:hypothetical protein